MPDTSIWNFEKGYLRNHEAQYYAANRLENARVEDSVLVLEARRDNWEGHEITSASLNTYGKKSYDPYIVHANIHTKAYNNVLKSNRGIMVEKPWGKYYIDYVRVYKHKKLYFK